MAQTLSQSRHARSVRTGGVGFLNSILIYLAAAGAATRTSVAVGGHLQPSERDLQTLGIEHTPAYAAVVRD